VTRTLLRSVLGVVAVAVALGATSPLPAAAQDDPATTTTTAASGGNGAPQTPSGDPAIDDLVGCMQGSRRLSVLFLIDESASLKATDPDDQRVEAARGALDSLISLASAEGSAAPQVDVALAAFSNEYRLVQDWTAAGPKTADTLNEALAKFADFNSGIDTDFVNALSAGREALADQAAEVTSNGGQAPCRAIMLFTDGGYDLAVRTSQQDEERLGTTKPYAPGLELTSKADVLKAEAAGRKALCKPGGLADRLRNDDITLLTVALSGDVARRAQLPLAAATAGTADDYTCGTQPKKGEDARAPGAYLPAEDIDVLVTQFNGVGIRLAGGNLVPGPGKVEICGDDPCDEGSRTFTLDKTLRRAEILALPPKEGAAVVIEGPEGDPVTITEPGRSQVGGTTVVARSLAERGFAIDLERPKDLASWNGEWKVAITDPSGSQEGDQASLRIYVFSDIGVSFGRLPSLQRGASTSIEVRLVVPKGVKAADVIESSEAQVRLRNPVTGSVEAVPLEGSPAGPFKGTVTTSDDTTTNVMEATAEVRITTRSGAELVSQSAPSEVLVRRPDGAIQFAPGSLKMPSLTGEGTSETELVLLGGDEPGCVWFGKAKVDDPPDGAAPVEVTYQGEPLPGAKQCIPVPAKKPTTITIEATPAGRACGTVSGTLEVFEKAQGAEDGTTTQIPFRFDMARGVDEARRLLLTVVLLLVGLGLPLVALLVINAIAARFQVLDAVRGAAIPVRVKGSTIQRTDGTYPKPLALRPADFVSLASTGTHRSFTFGGVVFRARASRNPFGGTIAMAAPEGGAERLKGGEGSRVELDPSLAGSWVFLLDAERTRRASKDEIDGLLIAFVAEGDFSTQTNRMVPDIAQRLPGTASSLAGLVRETRRKAPSKRQAKAAAAKADGGAVEPDEDVEDADDGGAIDEAPAEPTVDDARDAEAPDERDAADEGEAADDDAIPEERSAPTGFGGTSGAGVPTPPPVVDGPDDDDPGGPPVGFSGVRPDR
jgi:hypothetical protein